MTDDLLGYSVHFIFGGIVSLMYSLLRDRNRKKILLLSFISAMKEFKSLRTLTNPAFPFPVSYATDFST